MKKINLKLFIKLNSMATHDFSTSLNYEQSKFPKADKFYTEKLKATLISRIGFEDEDSKALQRMDIDVALTINGNKILVSEKDRQDDWGDLLLEFYSKYPNTKGWMDNSKADFMAYFVPNYVYWINKKELTDFYKNILSPAVPNNFFSEIIEQYPRQSKRVSKEILISGVKQKIFVVSAYNFPRNSNVEWYTLNICITYNLLSKNGVTIIKYAL